MKSEVIEPLTNSQKGTLKIFVWGGRIVLMAIEIRTCNDYYVQYWMLQYYSCHSCNKSWWCDVVRTNISAKVWRHDGAPGKWVTVIRVTKLCRTQIPLVVIEPPGVWQNRWATWWPSHRPRPSMRHYINVIWCQVEWDSWFCRAQRHEYATRQSRVEYFSWIYDRRSYLPTSDDILSRRITNCNADLPANFAVINSSTECVTSHITPTHSGNQL